MMPNPAASWIGVTAGTGERAPRSSTAGGPAPGSVAAVDVGVGADDGVGRMLGQGGVVAVRGHGHAIT